MIGQNGKEGQGHPGAPKVDGKEVLLAEIVRPYSASIVVPAFSYGKGPIVLVDDEMALTFSPRTRKRSENLLVIDRDFGVFIAFERGEEIGTKHGSPNRLDSMKNEIKGIYWLLGDRTSRGDDRNRCYIGKKYSIDVVSVSSAKFVGKVSSLAPIKIQSVESSIPPRDLLSNVKAWSAPS